MVVAMVAQVKPHLRNRHKQWHKRRQAAIEGGLRGCVLLFAGDVLLMCGSFQECMQHKTLPFRPSGGACAEAVRVPSIVGDVMAQYPGTP